jgi:hypothetical protein
MTGDATPHDSEGRLADGTRRNVYTAVRQLADTTDSRVFAELVQPLAEAARTLADDGDAFTLWKLVSILHEIASEGPHDPGTRAAVAAAFVRAVSNPTLLAPIARLALTPPNDVELCARRLLVLAGARGAHALYSARLRNDDPEVRRAFVLILTEIGGNAAPVVRAALERLDGNTATELVCDLLDGLAASGDEALAKMIATYARSKTKPIARAAAAAQERAKALARAPSPT